MRAEDPNKKPYLDCIQASRQAQRQEKRYDPVEIFKELLGLYLGTPTALANVGKMSATQRQKGLEAGTEMTRLSTLFKSPPRLPHEALCFNLLKMGSLDEICTAIDVYTMASATSQNPIIDMNKDPFATLIMAYSERIPEGARLEKILLFSNIIFPYMVRLFTKAPSYEQNNTVSTLLLHVSLSVPQSDALKKHLSSHHPMLTKQCEIIIKGKESLPKFEINEKKHVSHAQKDNGFGSLNHWMKTHGGTIQNYLKSCLELNPAQKGNDKLSALKTIMPEIPYNNPIYAAITNPLLAAEILLHLSTNMSVSQRHELIISLDLKDHHYFPHFYAMCLIYQHHQEVPVTFALVQEVLPVAALVDLTLQYLGPTFN